jgi:hypothetical protein
MVMARDEAGDGVWLVIAAAQLSLQANLGQDRHKNGGNGKSGGPYPVQE